ncbi:MAG: RnfH family protein [Pseudomonadota bacterium]|nr:RnfH family protein [Pseudomonadota bacterium]
MTHITVTAVYATPDRQSQVTLSLSDGATLADAITAMYALPDCEKWCIDAGSLGVFGKIRPLQWVLTEGDRVECYRPLEADPKTARRLRAAAQKHASR